jgi:hypothetical protein
LTIISPKQQVKQFKLTLLPKAGVEDDFQIYYDQKPLKTERIDLVNGFLLSNCFRYVEEKEIPKIAKKTMDVKLELYLIL